MNLEIEKTLVVTTGHIQYSTTKWMDDEKNASVSVDAYEYGWRVYVGSDFTPDPHIPPDLYVLMKLAHDNGCKWLRLDCDGDELDGFQMFDWMEEKSNA